MEAAWRLRGAQREQSTRAKGVDGLDVDCSSRCRDRLLVLAKRTRIGVPERVVHGPPLVGWGAGQHVHHGGGGIRFAGYMAPGNATGAFFASSITVQSSYAAPSSPAPTDEVKERNQDQHHLQGYQLPKRSKKPNARFPSSCAKASPARAARQEKAHASPSDRSPAIPHAMRHDAVGQTGSSHGKSCGSICEHVRYGRPPSRRSSSRKFLISGLTVSFALFLISSMRRSKRFKLSRL